jgi:excisionase family DNA binding protein
MTERYHEASKQEMLLTDAVNLAELMLANLRRALSKALGAPEEKLTVMLPGSLIPQVDPALLVEKEGAEPEPEFLTVDEAAAILRVGRNAAYDAIERGEIPGVQRVGRLIRIRRKALLGIP